MVKLPVALGGRQAFRPRCFYTAAALDKVDFHGSLLGAAVAEVCQFVCWRSGFSRRVQ